MQKINSTIQPKTEILSLSSTITGKKTTDDKDQIHSHTQPIIAKRKITKIQKLEKKFTRSFGSYQLDVVVVVVVVISM